MLLLTFLCKRRPAWSRLSHCFCSPPGFSPTMVHKCGWHCLGPLTFHGQVVGDKIRLSQGGRLAERNEDTFRDGLVFSSRPVRPNERIRLRVHSRVSRWKGAVRVGFTTVPPSCRSEPLPGMAIPDLTSDSCHWAAPVDESLCPAGSVLEFWVSSSGKIRCSVNNNVFKLLSGVDLSKPLWAMVDVYGQTSSICLLGERNTPSLHFVCLRARFSCSQLMKPSVCTVNAKKSLTDCCTPLCCRFWEKGLVPQ